MKNLLSLIILLTVAFSQGNFAFAQENKAHQNKWMEEVRNFKHSFLIKETQMSDGQSKLFIPLYTEMEDKVYQANRNARQLEADLSREKDEVSDEQYTAVAKALSDVTVIEGEIEKEYFKIFEKILSPKQMFLLKRAENRFAVEMLNHNKRSKAKQGNE
jgi:hypothetical protein